MNPPALLLIEDDRDYVDVIVRALRKAGLGVEFRVARDGQEALDVLGLDAGNGDGGSLPRVVLLDLTMPRMDGGSARRIAPRRATTVPPVVVVSSSIAPRTSALSCASANSYLLKRFDRRGPGADLAEAARYWIEMNR